MIRKLIFYPLFLLAIVGVGAYFFRIPILETVLSRSLDTEVTLEDASIGWKSLTLKNIHLASAAHTFPFDFQTETLTVICDPASLFKKRIHFQKIKLQGVQLEMTAIPSLKKESQLVRKSSSERSFIIDQLRVQDLEIKVAGPKKDLKLPKIPYLEVYSVGSRGNFDFSQICQLAFQEVLENVQTQKYMTNLVGKTDSSSLQNNFKESAEAARKKTEEVKKYLQDLFKK